jgi:hypothetical protein
MLRRLHRIVDVDHAAAPVLTLVFLGGAIACALHLPKIRRIRPCQKNKAARRSITPSDLAIPGY